MTEDALLMGVGYSCLLYIVKEMFIGVVVVFIVGGVSIVVGGVFIVVPVLFIAGGCLFLTVVYC